MLTTGAFNAFLKTLEEPPAHVIFVMATTDPQKIPTTILSRCQRFDLKRISIDDIVGRLAYICEQEKIQIEESNPRAVLEYIAKEVDGGMRDAIKLLQKCTSLDETITVQTVVDALGSVNSEHLDNMSSYLLNKDVRNTLMYFNKLVMEGVDIKVFIADLIEYFTDSMKNDVVNNNFDIESRIGIANALFELSTTLSRSTQPKAVTELKFINICNSERACQSAPVEENKPAPSKKELQQTAESLNMDPQAVQDVIKRLTGVEQRLIASEMMLDQLRFKR